MKNNTIDKDEFFRVMDELQFDGEHHVTVDGQHALLVEGQDGWLLHLAKDDMRDHAVIMCEDVERFEINGWGMKMVMKNGEAHLVCIMETHWLDPSRFFGKKQNKTA